MRDVTCIVCGVVFPTPHSRHTICSPECRQARRRTYDAGVSAEVGGLPPPERPCPECGKSTPNQRGRKYCSRGCQRENKRRRDLERWRTSPERRAAVLASAKQRRKDKPEQARAQDRRKWARTKADPARLEASREKARQHYARHAEVIQQRRREALEALSPEERAAWLQRAADYTARWKARNLERHAYGQAIGRRLRRERKAQEELALLAAVAEGRLDTPAPPRPCRYCSGPIVGRKAQALHCGGAECKRAYSREKGMAWRDRHLSRTCVICGAAFRGRGALYTCSPECKIVYKRLTRRAKRKQQIILELEKINERSDHDPGPAGEPGPPA